MEIKLELATEPAVKGTIAVVACVSIAYISTHAETPNGFASSFSDWYHRHHRRYIQDTSASRSRTQLRKQHIKHVRHSISGQIKAQMPHTTLTRVLGEPTHKQVKMVIRELTANLMAVSCPWGHKFT
jgi:hypothetical protein